MLNDFALPKISHLIESDNKMEPHLILRDIKGFCTMLHVLYFDCFLAAVCPWNYDVFLRIVAVHLSINANKTSIVFYSILSYSILTILFYFLNDLTRCAALRYTTQPCKYKV